jgi:hypothetical protein
MTTRREKPPIFAFLERLVEFQQGSGLQDNRQLSKPACRNEQRSKTQNEAIEGIQVRRPPPRTAADDQLVLQQDGLSQDGAHAARAYEFGDSDQQVDGEYEQVNHRHRR